MFMDVLVHTTNFLISEYNLKSSKVIKAFENI
jgi:hypothetical protein